MKSYTTRLDRHIAFFDIATLSDKDYANLDAATIIYANYRRYIGELTSRLGSLTEYEMDDLAGIFWDLGHSEIERVKVEYLNSDGERRKRAILGTLKAIAQTRVAHYLVKRREGPKTIAECSYEDGRIYISCPKSSANDDDKWFAYDTFQSDPTQDPSVSLMFAAEAIEGHLDEPDENQWILEKLESIRHLFRHTQYEMLVQLAICGFSTPISDIAEEMGCSVRKLYWRLAGARETLWENLTESQKLELSDCLKRRKTR